MERPIIDVEKNMLSSKIVDIDENSIAEAKPTIGLTYLDNTFNLTNLFKTARGNKTKIKDFESFLEKARNYKTLSELIRCHKPADKLKNNDEKSKKKLADIQKRYNIETSEMFHLHCCRNGKGEFVLHGFRINNCFEIVWLDPDHLIHKSK